MFLEQIKMAPGTLYTAADPANAFFFISTCKDHQKVAFTYQWSPHTFTAPWGQVYSFLCHNIVYRDIDLTFHKT